MCVSVCECVCGGGEGERLGVPLVLENRWEAGRPRLTSTSILSFCVVLRYDLCTSLLFECI